MKRNRRGNDDSGEVRKQEEKRKGCKEKVR